MTPRRPWTALAIVGLAAPLCFGCVTLLPKKAQEPLYRLGGGETTAAAAMADPGAPASGGGALGVTVTLPAAAQGDALLAVSGHDVAYISGGRWVSPAAVLVREAVVRSLAGRGGTGSGPAALTLTVTRFETDYAAGFAGAPTVRIDGTLRLSDGARGGRSLGEVHGSGQAADNRIGAIVVAYDAALAQVLATAVAALDRDAQSTTRDRPDQRDQANSGLPVRPR